MTKSDITREDFLMAVAPEHQEFAAKTIDFMQKEGCDINIESKKTGYVLSFVHRASKKTVANFVFRKSGLITRIYADNLSKYAEFIESLPDAMAKDIIKASSCKRLLNPDDCNSRCPMGYTFTLRGEEYKKCRYNAFMLKVTGESIPFIESFIQREAKARAV